MKADTHGLFPHDHVTLIEVGDVISQLSDDLDPATIQQLYDFGKLSLDQIRWLRSSYDSKLTSCLGWATTTTAVMLVGFGKWSSQGWVRALALTGLSAAILCVLACIIGFKSIAGWKWPSEKDWFNTEYFKWPNSLKKQHIIAMLEAHQSYSRKTQRKGQALMAAEYLLALSALCLGIAVLFRQLGF
jgi:hypothetical protein